MDLYDKIYFIGAVSCGVLFATSFIMCIRSLAGSGARFARWFFLLIGCVIYAIIFNLAGFFHISK